jgi:NAD(P)H-dependent FMN reductase
MAPRAESRCRCGRFLGPDGNDTDPAVVELRAAIAASDAVLFSTPEYAGALPGSFKDLLDWTVPTRRSGRDSHGPSMRSPRR